jgi:choline dehydrogenase-like flavoprotein
MIVDFCRGDSPANYRAKICVIGSGPVGLSFISEFLDDSAQDIIIVESGGLKGDPADEALNEVVNTGEEPSGLADSRARVFGGTSTLWGGQAIPLSPLDFDQRPWVDNSGWPISYADLVPYFEKAAEILRIDNSSYDTDIWKKGKAFKQAIDEDVLRLTFSKWSPTPDFSRKFAPVLKQSRHVTLLLHANVTELQAAEDGQAVRGVSITSRGGREGCVKAEVFVLCCGGIENARILLYSNSVIPEGLGNEHGNVGRFFQDHAGFYVARLIPRNFRAFVDLFSSYFRGDQMFLPKLQLSENEQRNRETLNVIGNVGVEYRQESALARKRRFNHQKSRTPGRSSFRDAMLALKSPFDSLRLLYSYGISRRMHYPREADYFLIANCETEPNAASRVSLSSESDALGLPKAEVHWVNTEAGKYTLRTYAEHVREQIERLGIAEVVIKPSLLDEGDEWKRSIYSLYHHIGTTRMSNSSASGVVDSHCRVHGLDNLYVGGCSVFPTSGAANPTFTAMALALKLADSIKAQME